MNIKLKYFVNMFFFTVENIIKVKHRKRRGYATVGVAKKTHSKRVEKIQQPHSKRVKKIEKLH